MTVSLGEPLADSCVRLGIRTHLVCMSRSMLCECIRPGVHHRCGKRVVKLLKSGCGGAPVVSLETIMLCAILAPGLCDSAVDLKDSAIVPLPSWWAAAYTYSLIKSGLLLGCNFRFYSRQAQRLGRALRRLGGCPR